MAGKTEGTSAKPETADARGAAGFAEVPKGGVARGIPPRLPAFPRRAGLAAILAGVVHATSFSPDPLPAWVLAFVQLSSMAALVHWVWQAACTRHAAWLGLLFGLGHFTVGLYWLHISIHTYGGVAWLPAALAVLLLAAFLALYPAAAAALAWRLRPHPFTAALAWASSWTLLEWLRGTLFTGFPWLNVAYAHTDSVFAGWAGVTGAYGVAWFAAFAAATLALMVSSRIDPDRTRTGRADASTNTATTAAHWLPALLVTAAAAAGGALLATIAWTVPHGQILLARLVQGNVAQSDKFSPALLRTQLEHYVVLAALPPKDERSPPDLIVLPETVIPVLQNRLPEREWQRWRDLARAQNATLLLGAPVHTVRDQRHVYTNSVLAIDASTDVAALMHGATQRYDKSHLVPFGEFIPAGFRWFVDAMAIPLGDFDRGAPRQPLFSIAGQTVAPNICYEDVFGEEILQSVRAAQGDGGATVLINFSNLAWFGDSWALRQHLQMARLRSMETGRPMLRATNTGMTAAISPQGTVYAVLPAQQAGVLDVEVQGMQGLTPYVRTGNAPVLAWLVVTLLACWVGACAHKPDHEPKRKPRRSRRG